MSPLGGGEGRRQLIDQEGLNMLVMLVGILLERNAGTNATHLGTSLR